MIVFTIDGVLRDPFTNAFIPAGVALYNSLGERVTTAIIGPPDKDEAFLRHWLTTNKIESHYLVRPQPLDAEDPGQCRVEQLTRLRQSGAVDLLVESDPEVAAAVLHEGIPTMLFCAPAYSRPEHLPGERRLPTAWAVLMGEMDRQQAIKASDTRIVPETV